MKNKLFNQKYCDICIRNKIFISVTDMKYFEKGKYIHNKIITNIGPTRNVENTFQNKDLTEYNLII